MDEKTDQIRREQSIQSPVSDPGGPSSVPGEEQEDLKRLHSEIERTRLEMSRTLNEIRTHMSPARIREAAKAKVKQRARRMAETANVRAKGMRDHISYTIRQNPLPAALVGLSTGWLIKKGIQSARSRREMMEYEYEYGPGESEPHLYTGISEPAGQEPGLESSHEEAGRMKEGMQEKVEHYRRRAGETAESWRGTAREQAARQRQRIQYGFGRMMDENPLIVTAAALALGALIGSAVPETEKEHELMGESRDRLMGKAKEKGRESMEKAKAAAEQTAEHAKEEAERQGLT